MQLPHSTLLTIGTVELDDSSFGLSLVINYWTAAIAPPTQALTVESTWVNPRGITLALRQLVLHEFRCVPCKLPPCHGIIMAWHSMLWWFGFKPAAAVATGGGPTDSATSRQLSTAVTPKRSFIAKSICTKIPQLDGNFLRERACFSLCHYQH